MTVHLFLSLYLFYLGFCDIRKNYFDKLDDLGCSELQKSLVKWMINNFFVLLYFLNEFRRPWILNDGNLLKIGSIGIALATAWIPVVKNKNLFLNEKSEKN
ncbi:hypothetical protein CRE_15593 [Caenorhabditis remanei]|uniref:Uncharacterized protein n=1 Tax=Caenorhabditis remanei TaxID=31234 RepID=E3N2M4_CAERE|nr:hypothetical protein CRE_15593 [Caenorhabditis remanei]